MNISAPFIRRPVATSLLTAALLLYGFIAFRELPVASLPEVAYPVVQVQADLPGANAETMASSVATPLERMFGRIAGVNQMTSLEPARQTPKSPCSLISIAISTPLRRDVQAAINAARGQLPANLPTNPNWTQDQSRRSAHHGPGAYFGHRYPRPMFDMADSILAQKTPADRGHRPGAGGRQLAAGRPRRSQPAAVEQAGHRPGSGARGDLMAPMPIFRKVPSRIRIAAFSWIPMISFSAPTIMGALIIAYNHKGAGPLVRRGHRRKWPIEYHQRGIDQRKADGRVGSFPPALGQYHRHCGSRQGPVLPMLRASIPPSITLTVAQDRTTTIRASVHDVEVTLVIAVLLVILVIFAFLHSIWATAIPSVAVPLSLVGTFGVMYLLGYTIDNLSLMALTISTGFVVDDAIVVIENITRYLEKGMAPLEAALAGSKEIGFTVLSMSTSLIAVFIPILLMGGILGRIFREFAITLSVAVAISLVVSLTATPMMCAYLLKRQHHNHRRNPISRALQSAFDSMAEGYAGSLRWVLGHQPLMLCVLLGTIGLAVYLYMVIPKGFFPQQDTGRLSGQALSSEDTSFQTMRQKLTQFIAILQSDPAVAVVTGNIGARSNQAAFNVTLKPLAERKAERGSGDQPAAAPAGPRARSHAYPPGGAGCADRRPPRRRPIPVHPAGRQT